MDDNRNMLEPPLKDGSGNQVVESCVDHLSNRLNGNDEGVASNPAGSVTPDVQQVPTVLLKCKKITNISTFNLRTGKDDWRIHELIHHMDDHKISIIAFQEHRRVHEDEQIKYQHIDNHLLVTASAWRNTAQAAVGGVGLLLNPAAEKMLSDITWISDRVIKATFAGNPESTIIVAYSPTNDKKHTEEVATFYDHLRQAIDSSPTHNFLMILGDLNAKISSAHARFAHDKRTNENGKHLLDLVNEKSLVITNTVFDKRMGKRWTFEDPKCNRFLLDYILVNSKWKNSILNTEAYSSFASVGSDHRIVTARVQLSLRATKSPTTKKRYDWKLLRHDHELQATFSLHLRNKFELLYDESATATSQYESLVKANEFAASETLPLVQKGKFFRHANNPTIVQARKKVDQLTRRYNISKSRIAKKHLQEARANLQKEYNLLEDSILQQQIDEVQLAFQTSDTGKAWKIVNTITNRKASPTGKLNGKSPDERKKQWFNHFKTLLGTPDNLPPPTEIKTILHNLNIYDGEFTLDEVIEAKKQVREGKAPGEDGIMPEVIKRVNIDDIILQFSNKLMMEGQKPEQFSVLNLQPIPKSGNLGLTDNYRGISLMSIVAKIFNRMLLNRIRPKIDPLLRGNQSGFRPGRSTTTQVLALRRIIEGVRNRHLPAVMIFIDFCKAFDSINHQTMFAILAAYDIPKRILNAIIEIYNNIKAKVKSPDGDTDYFKIHAGVMQGDTLAPFLFVIVLDYAMRQATEGKEEELGFTLSKRRSRRVPAKSITDLDFADDIVLLSDEIEQARVLLHGVERECKKVGLDINAKKTKSMFFNTEPEIINTLQGKQVKQALTESKDQDFKYLGSWCDKNRDIDVRKALAWRSLHKMKKVWKSDLPNERKLQLFRATTETILLYGCATWSLTKKEEKSLDGTYTRMLRMVYNIKWNEHVTNDKLYGNLSRLTDNIRNRRLKLAGHVFRDKSSPAHMTITWAPQHGTASRGRPTTTFVDTLLRDTSLDNAVELEGCMEDRDIWRSLQSRCPGGSDRK